MNENSEIGSLPTRYNLTNLHSTFFDKLFYHLNTKNIHKEIQKLNQRWIQQNTPNPLVIIISYQNKTPFHLIDRKFYLQLNNFIHYNLTLLILNYIV